MSAGCGNCRFWSPEPLQPKTGGCRKNPPAVMLVQTPAGPSINSAFPPVGRDQWCGEFVATKATCDDASGVPRDIGESHL
jgi:hypothetical protein